MPKPLPMPDGSQLDLEKKSLLIEMVNFIQKQKFDWDRIHARQEEFVQRMNATCSSDEDVEAWWAEVDRWVFWFNNYGYSLAFFLAGLTALRKSKLHVLSLDLLADAQCTVSEDLALHTQELAWDFVLANRDRFTNFDAVLQPYYTWRLEVIHDYFYRYATPFTTTGSIPLTDNLYSFLTANLLARNFPEVKQSLDSGGIEGFDQVIEKCSTPELVYYRVLAHRHLGIAYSLKQNLDAGTEQFLRGLKLADEVHLETELGHLQRLYGYNLRLQGKFADSQEQLRQVTVREMESGTSTYWSALSFREMADTIAASPNWEGDEKQRILLMSSSFNGRRALDMHLGMCAIPIARNAKQQLMRAFSERAIQYAHSLNRAEDVLGEIEASGPREATDVALEIAAARRNAPEKLVLYRKNRASYYRVLSTASADFESYIADFEVRFQTRDAYLQARRVLSPEFAVSALSAENTKDALALNLVGILMMFFHIGQFQSTAVLVNFETHQIDIEEFAFTTSTIAAIHKKYIDSSGTEGANPEAISTMLVSYETLLGDYLRRIKPLLQGRHLKVFPRLEMNILPFHALRVDGEYLIEICDISYGQTLGLFLENHAAIVEDNARDLMMVCGDALPCYAGALQTVSATYGDRASRQDSPLWLDLIEMLKHERPRDILFACHGVFDRKAPDRSHLDFANDRMISFEDIFADLDLRGSRSIFVGACESGIARASINAEYIGLSCAMLASGVPYVVGALWQVNELATAILVERYSVLLRSEPHSIPAALCQAQRELLHMTRDELTQWVVDRLTPIIPALVSPLQAAVANMNAQPFADPAFWAGLQVTGAL